MNSIIKRNKNGNGGMPSTRSLTPFGNLLNNFFDDDFWGFDGVLSNRQVPVNVRETDKSYELELVAPGLRKEDFNVNISDNLLTISFEHKEEEKQENKQEGYLRHEFRMQSFSRSFALDDTVDVEGINAQYRDGILYLNLPKKESAQRLNKSIRVQ